MSRKLLAPKSTFGRNFHLQQNRKRNESDDVDEWRPEPLKNGRTTSKHGPTIVTKRRSKPLSPVVITLDDNDDENDEMEIDIPLELENIGEDPLKSPSGLVPAEDIVNGILDFTNVVRVSEPPAPVEFNFVVPNPPKRVARTPRWQKNSVASINIGLGNLNIPKFLKPVPKISKPEETVSKAEMIKSTTLQETICANNVSKTEETIQKASISKADLCSLRQDLHLSDDESSGESESSEEESESDPEEEKNNSKPETKVVKTESKMNQLQSQKNMEKSSFKIIRYRGKNFQIGQKTPRECPHCFKEFANDIDLANHSISVHTPTVHHCHKCSITFARPMELHRHNVNNHPMRPLAQTETVRINF